MARQRSPDFFRLSDLLAHKRYAPQATPYLATAPARQAERAATRALAFSTALWLVAVIRVDLQETACAGAAARTAIAEQVTRASGRVARTIG